MENERRSHLHRQHGIQFVDFNRQKATGVLFASGCGIGLSVMDVCPVFRWFVDIDNYRTHSIDWESVGIVLAMSSASIIGFVGWFTIDRPESFEKLKQGMSIRAKDFKTYIGGGDLTLSDWIYQANSSVIFPR